MNEEEEKNKKFVNLDFCVYDELNGYTHTQSGYFKNKQQQQQSFKQSQTQSSSASL